jgi:hypothetical protein
MLLISFISALILLESRDVFQGLLSQPFVTALLLIWAGYDQNFILASATIVHLIYLNYTPSGTTLFPEYPFGFFITVSLMSEGEQNIITLIILLALIILISAFTARFLAFKRRQFEKYRERLLFYKGIPSLTEGLFFTFIIFFIYSLVAGLLLKLLSFGINSTAINKVAVPYSGTILTFMCLIPVIFYAYKNFRIRI